MTEQTLYQKVLATEPGKHAATVGEIVYNFDHKIGVEASRQLRDVQHYLEKLAHEIISKEVPGWVREFYKKEEE